MISDVKASQEMSQLFKEKETTDISIPINYFVLSNYTWPIDTLISGEINNFDLKPTQKKFRKISFLAFTLLFWRN